MKLRLTWRARGQKDIDLIVSAEQKISETMNILAEREIFEKDIVDSAKYIKSLRTNNQVNILLTYNEANIYAGDILEL